MRSQEPSSTHPKPEELRVNGHFFILLNITLTPVLHYKTSLVIKIEKSKQISVEKLLYPGVM